MKAESRALGSAPVDRPKHDVCLYIVKRTQIYLDEHQTARLDQRAAAEGTSRSTLIRRAVDVYLAREEQSNSAWQSQWRKAVRGTAGVASHLDEGADYVEGIRGVDSERLSRFDR